MIVGTGQWAQWAVAAARATGNSRFETEKFPSPAQRKIPENFRCLSSLIITVSAMPARFIRPAFPRDVYSV